MDCALWADVLAALETVVRYLLVWVILAHLSRLLRVRIPQVWVKVLPIIIAVVISKVIPWIISGNALVAILVRVSIGICGHSVTLSYAVIVLIVSVQRSGALHSIVPIWRWLFHGYWLLPFGCKFLKLDHAADV